VQVAGTKLADSQPLDPRVTRTKFSSIQFDTANFIHPSKTTQKPPYGVSPLVASMASPRPRIYRISGIPRLWTEDSVRNALREQGVDIQLEPFRLMPSCLDLDTFTATVAIGASNHTVLRKILENPLESEIFPCQGASLVVDQNFAGLTTLACASAESQIQAR